MCALLQLLYKLLAEGSYTRSKEIPYILLLLIVIDGENQLDVRIHVLAYTFQKYGSI